MLYPRVWVLSGVWTLALMGQAAGFDQMCGVLPGWSSARAGQLSPVVAVHATGRATGTYMEQREAGPRWRLGIGNFTSTGHGVIVGSFVVTAAHVVSPSKVEIQVHQWGATLTPVVTVVGSFVTVKGSQETDGMPADIVYLDQRFDLAILQPNAPTALQPLLYPAAETWLPEIPGTLSSLLQAEDCVVSITAGRDDGHTPLPWYTTREGRVVAPYAVSDMPRGIAELNPNTVTISTPLLPGDSGSPVLAFIEGRPWLVGIATATRYPAEPLSYISRIDPLLPILEALQESPSNLLQAWHRPSMPSRDWAQE